MGRSEKRPGSNEGAAAAARRKAFVAAARIAFFAQGYAGTTMSSIAARVGGSKSTLWSYFPSKEDLFTAVVDDIVERYGKALLVDLPEDGPLEEVLTRFGLLLMATLLSPPALSLHRLVLSEAERFPHLAETFFDRGPRRGKARLAAWFAIKMDRGEMPRADPLAAARHFVGLCQAGRFQAALFNLPDEGAGPGSTADEVADAVGHFLGGWGGRAWPTPGR